MDTQSTMEQKEVLSKEEDELAEALIPQVSNPIPRKKTASNSRYSIL